MQPVYFYVGLAGGLGDGPIAESGFVKAEKRRGPGQYEAIALLRFV
jgi:hypothetical protein